MNNNSHVIKYDFSLESRKAEREVRPASLLLMKDEKRAEGEGSLRRRESDTGSLRRATTLWQPVTVGSKQKAEHID